MPFIGNAKIDETDIAAASTCDLGSVSTVKATITGTTTITGFGPVANRLRFLTFAGALTLTHNATSLILPTAANITTAVGDTAIAESDNSGNWRVTNYQRADGTSLASSQFRGCSAAMSGAQSIPNATSTVVLFDSEDFDTSSIHNTSTNNSRLTVPAGVSYVSLSANMQWASAGGSYRIGLIKKNGATVISQDFRPPVFETYATISMGPISVSPGDYFELFVQQDSGGNLDFGYNIARFKMTILK